jgi:hypothetical protein
VQTVKGVSNIAGRYISCTYRRRMQPYFFSGRSIEIVFVFLIFSYASYLRRLVEPYYFALSTTGAVMLLIEG